MDDTADRKAAPEFDLMKYLAMAKEFDMSEEEKTELLMILWDIMQRFVELGFGIDSASISQQVVDRSEEKSTSESKEKDVQLAE